MNENVVSIARQLIEAPIEPIAPEQKEPAVVALIELCERLDEGLRLASSVIAQHEDRIRKLELAENKRQRKIAIIKPGHA